MTSTAATARAPIAGIAGRLAGLRTFNVVVGLAHAGQAILMVALSNDLSLPVSASFLDADPATVREPTAAEEVLSLRIGWAVAAFLALAAADHLAVAAPRVHHWYDRQLAGGINPARWAEYSVSASIMIVLIAMFTGIRDLAALIALFGVNTAMILFGWLMERHQSPGRPDWSAFWFGSLAGAVPWIAIGVYLAGSATPPGFVWAIVVTQFVLFFSFAANMVLQYRRLGPWRDYLFGERAYVVLSLVAKSLLAWLIFANVLRT
jgi:hypothetical protein